MKRPLALLGAIALAGLAVTFGHHLLWPHARWENEGLHVALEAWGSIYAFVMALVLWHRGRRGRGRDLALASAFIGMGFMDAMVAVTSGMREQDVFHGLSCLSAAGWFAAAWLPVYGARRARLVPWVFAAAALAAIGVVFWVGRARPGILAAPGMEPALAAVHVVSGALFAVSTVLFVAEHRRGGGREALVFACIALLFAMVEISIPWSTRWADDWWIWHAMRFATLAASFWLVVAGSHEALERLAATEAGKQEAEAALSMTELRYRVLAEFSADCIWTAGMDLRFTYMSPAVRRILGYETADAGSLDARRILTPESFDRAMEAFAREMRSLETDGGTITKLSLDLEMVRSDGSRVWTETMFSYLRGADGRPTGILGVTRDISRRRKEEAERRMLEAELEQARRLESVGKLAGGVAHDFNNLLAIIINSAEFAAAGLEPGDRRLEDIEQIKRAGKRAADLTRQLLDFSRRQLVRPEVIRLGDVVEEARKLLSRTIGEDVELRVECDPAARPVKVDPGRMQQVVMNLVANSRDAMPGGGKIGISVFDEGADVVLEVTDTGRGMTEEVRSSAFEPFFTTKEKGRGTGLGLSTVYGIVKQAGGDVTIESEPGEGTEVRVRLPASGEAPDGPRKSSIPPAGPAATRTVLVVEDDESVLGLVRRMLAIGGYDVLEAHSGDEAVEAAGRHGGIDLLLTDVVMPRMGGPEAAERIRRLHPGVRVLYMSGYADGRAGIEDRGAGFIQKPFTMNGLLGKVAELLGEASA